MACLRDGFNRPISYLRISVTDRCNFRCFYCMPKEGVENRCHADILTYEEIALIVRAAAELCTNKVRLTGGEPLVRSGMVEFVKMLADIPGIDDLAMTTNGFLLAPKAKDLKEAGLRRVNVSLDTLQRDKFEKITGVPAFDKVMDGIVAAYEVGLRPVKINVVAVRGVNDDEIVDFAAMTMEHDWNIRFIELMPIGQSAAWTDKGYLPVNEIKERISVLGPLEPDEPKNKGQKAEVANEAQEGLFSLPNGPARYFRLPGAKGTIGFISPVSDHFCPRCNRLRLTADGRLLGCLFSSDETDIRPLIAGGRRRLVRSITDAISRKKYDRRADGGARRQMSRIGG